MIQNLIIVWRYMFREQYSYYSLCHIACENCNKYDAWHYSILVHLGMVKTSNDELVTTIYKFNIIYYLLGNKYFVTIIIIWLELRPGMQTQADYPSIVIGRKLIDIKYHAYRMYTV